MVGQIGSESIKCFEDHNTALAFAKLMSGQYNYVHFYEDEVKQWDS